MQRGSEKADGVDDERVWLLLLWWSDGIGDTVGEFYALRRISQVDVLVNVVPDLKDSTSLKSRIVVCYAQGSW